MRRERSESRPFLPGAGALSALLGRLERRVMELVWELGEASVRDVQARLGTPAAYTTVMTTLDRLHRKGLLERRKVGRAFSYSASAPRVEMAVLDQLVAGLFGRGPLAGRPLLSNFVEVLSHRDHDLLDELHALVQEKKRELQRKKER
jgi:predicted transcriptional regulator